MKRVLYFLGGHLGALIGVPVLGLVCLVAYAAFVFPSRYWLNVGVVGSIALVTGAYIAVGMVYGQNYSSRHRRSRR